MKQPMHDEDSQPATRGDLKSEMRDFREEMRDLLRPIVALLTRHSAELADIRGYMRDKLVTRDEFHSRMDAFSGRVEDYEYGDAKRRARLDDHERRIGALESKKS